jgi:thiol-disulfide isomerase/thioredoxin
VSRLHDAVGLATLFFAASVVWPVSAADEEKAAAAQPAEKKTAQQADPYPVPEGTPTELVEFIKTLRPHLLRDPEAATRAQQAILKAAEKLLAAKGNAEEMKFAVEAKMNMLQNEQQLAAFAEELHNGGHEALAQQVRGFTVQLELRNAGTAGLEKKKEAIADALKFFEATPPQLPDVASAVMAGRLAERTSDNNLAINTYRSLAKVFGASKDNNLVEFAKTLEGVVRRLSLVGKEMKIEGKLLDKKEFDWSKYAGKVVLVDFWATWAGPCVAEIPNMKKCYNLYHAKGFDIIGLSCDRNLADLEKFVKKKNIPWAVVFGDGKPSPTVSYYGIMSIPTMVLVGKDGKVVSLNARGEKLKEELAKLLGPVEEKKEVKGGAEKKQEPNKMADGNNKK